MSVSAADYKTIFDESIAELDKQVRQALNEGWELFGNQYATGHGASDIHYQPVVRPARPTETSAAPLAS
jgi:hypothetical protein